MPPLLHVAPLFHVAPVFHVTFGDTAGETLTQALGLAGRAETVVAFPDDLSTGPIRDADAAARAQWLVEAFGPHGTYGRDLPQEMAAFRTAFDAAQVTQGATPVFWFTRRSAREYCGFLALLDQLGEAPVAVVDFTGATFVTRMIADGEKLRTYLGVGEMTPTAAAGFLPAIRPLAAGERDSHRRLWMRLRDENAPFRVLADGGIASAPITFFDAALLGATPAEWCKIAQVIGEVYGMAFEDNALAVDDRILAGRIRALVNADALDCRGSADDIRSGEVRRR